MEWRIGTIKCGSLLKLKDDTPQITAKIIQDFMTPLRPQPQDDAAKIGDKELHEKLLRLCKDAFDFTLTLRGCKDVYRCEFPKNQKPNDDDSEVQARERRIDSMEGGSGAEERRVLFTISGTLAKYPGGNMEKRLVLEKAHVVVR